MKRAIVTPPVLPPAALAELKQWLGITTARDDAPLVQLLRAALDMCEAFTGSLPLELLCEEVLPVASSWAVLGTRPVQAITAAWAIADNGTRTALAPGTFAVELDGDGNGHVLVTDAGGARRVAVRFTAGIAPDWLSLPEALRHGVIRLAAHQHRMREGDGEGPVPPAAVAALWRPWRRLRLS